MGRVLSTLTAGPVNGMFEQVGVSSEVPKEVGDLAGPHSVIQWVLLQWRRAWGAWSVSFFLRGAVGEADPGRGLEPAGT